MKKKQLKAVLIIALILVIVIGAGITALVVLFPSQRIVALILPQAEKALGRKVSLHKAGFSFFPRLGVSLADVKIDNTSRNGFSKEPFVRIDKLTASVSLLSLLRGDPEITSITIRKPVVLVETDTGGSFNFTDLGLPRTDTTIPNRLPVLPVPITLKTLRVKDGSIIYIDRKSGSRAVIGKVDQTMRLSIDRELRNITSTGKITLSDVSLQSKLLPVPIRGVSFDITHTLHADLPAGVMHLDSARLSLGPVSLLAAGSLSGLLSATQTADFTVTSNLSSAKRLDLSQFAPKLAVSGSAGLNARIQGAMGPGIQPAVTGSLKLGDFAVQYTDLPRSINGCNADISFTDKSLKIDDLAFKFGTSPVDIKGTVNGFDEPLVDAEIKALLNLDEAKEVVKLPAGAAVGGKIGADIKINGVADSADWGKLFCTGSIGLDRTSVLWPPLSVPAVLNGKITLEKEAATAVIAAALGSSSFNLNARAVHYLWLAVPPGKKAPGRANIDFTVNSGALDVDKIMGIIATPSAQDKGAVQPVSGPLPVIPPLPMADVHGVVTANRIVYQGYTFTNVTAKTVSVGNIADIGFNAGFAGGTIDNTIHADLRAAPAIAFMDKLAVRDVELNDLMAHFAAYLQPPTPLNRQLAQINKCLFGRINASGSLQGKGGTPEQIMKGLTGKVTLKMANGKIVNSPAQKVVAAAMGAFLKTDKLGAINPITFSSLDAAVHVQSGRAFIDQLNITSDLGDWSARGSVGFDAVMDLTITTKLNKVISAQILSLENTAKSAARNALQGTQLEIAAGLLDHLSLIPHDAEGRIPLRFGLAGPVDAPKITSLAFDGGSVQRSSSTPREPPRQDAGQNSQKIQQELQKAGEQLKEKLRGMFR